jgi:uncharacterized protein (DUF2252 family)
MAKTVTKGRATRSGASSTGAPAAKPARHPGRDERRAAGKQARVLAPLESHAEFEPLPGRDPLGLLLGQAASRVPELVPVRHGRMMVSPFTFYRGAALPMAADLATTRTSGLRVQLCGDAHLSNFGVFGSPERKLLFDINDFDETLPGPFEWDVKRLAASIEVAARQNGYTTKQRRDAVVAAAAAYRVAMREFACQPILEVWYAHADVEQVLIDMSAQLSAAELRNTTRNLSTVRSRDSMQAAAKLTRLVDGERRFVSDPPLIVPVEELVGEVDPDEVYRGLQQVYDGYEQSLPAERRVLSKQYRLSRVARKVVGVGSVGTRCWILLMETDDGFAPELLQAKEAQASVLADYAGPSAYDNQGERVVTGQRLMQAASDIFLGWFRMNRLDGGVSDYYFRQLRDWKFSAAIERMIPAGMRHYAQLCGWTLARAHARSGDRIAIASYLGKSDAFEQAIAGFAVAYANQNERDHAAMVDAVAKGEIEAVQGL